MTIGLIANNDGTGSLQLGGSNAITLDTSLNATMAGYVNAPNTFGFKNRIINGAMVIDQRNSGSSVSISGLANTYTLDRWQIRNDTDAVVSVQQSSTAPTGFTNSLLYTVTTADSSLGVSQNYSVQQRIEGFNMSDFRWGTASAQTVTLSFWVRSSLTGTFGGAIANSAANRSYPFTYTISAADTWEQKTLTIAGDTSGTWLTTNGIGAYIYFSTGAGLTVSGTAGAWASSDFRSATGAVALVTTNGATFSITGVQLEKGSLATSFDFRDYGRELSMCQRYFYRRSGSEYYSACYWQTTTQWNGCALQYPVTMRAAPIFTFAAASNFSIGVGGGSATAATIGASTITANSANISGTVSSGGTANAGGALIGGASASISISAEL
jgi:hypothetical protein